MSETAGTPNVHVSHLVPFLT